MVNKGNTLIEISLETREKLKEAKGNLRSYDEEIRAGLEARGFLL